MRPIFIAPNDLAIGRLKNSPLYLVYEERLATSG